MQWRDEGIILSVRKQGESSALVELFTHEHGRHGGLVKGAFSKTNRSMYLPGNQVEAEWNARLAEHLGHYRCELVRPIGALLMHEREGLQALHYLCELLRLCLPEREAHPRTFAQLVMWQEFVMGGAKGMPLQASIVLMELRLLAALGFGLDLTCCAATGQVGDLCYVSPKSGRAVSREAGTPYHDKMLPLPVFVQQGWQDELADFSMLSRPSDGEAYRGLDAQSITNGFRLTSYFLEKWVLAPVNRRLPDRPMPRLEVINA